MRTVRVDVTQEDIDKGLRGNAFSCPIARAIDRLAVCDCVEVGDDEIYLDAQGVPMSHEALCFVSDFDSGNMVEPFHFDLALPEQAG